jgi:hypothetical protein
MRLRWPARSRALSALPALSQQLLMTNPQFARDPVDLLFRHFLQLALT